MTGSELCAPPSLIYASAHVCWGAGAAAAMLHMRKLGDQTAGVGSGARAPGEDSVLSARPGT